MPVDNGTPEIETILDIREKQLSHQQGRELLALARQAIERHLSSDFVPEPIPSDPILYRFAGAFVTLWHVTRRASSFAASKPSSRVLRGCIGRTQADRPLCVVVAEMAVKAAVYDFRFPPVTAAELENIQIEISVLSPLEHLKDIDHIIIGHHGLMIIAQNQRGLLLPEVAHRYGWSQVEFVKNLCRKANLPSDQWHSPEAALFSFTTQTFEEGEFH